ncbi:hypothetical protein BpHYR1_024068 [Brachionus plicatilis]|uniref:Uncharacterized protein n=1 Tax=Brachionus plicatilis TaxID=10195 RepID=A0A3M7S0C4_BRAPC|nr:hypothetical protein BpHYR1_024068 [Brachionus plicatilis]
MSKDSKASLDEKTTNTITRSITTKNKGQIKSAELTEKNLIFLIFSLIFFNNKSNIFVNQS